MCTQAAVVCAHTHDAHSKILPNCNNLVCLVFTKQDLKFDQNRVIDSGDIGRARSLYPCVHVLTGQMSSK